MQSRFSIRVKNVIAKTRPFDELAFQARVILLKVPGQALRSDRVVNSAQRAEEASRRLPHTAIRPEKSKYRSAAMTLLSEAPAHRLDLVAARPAKARQDQIPIASLAHAMVKRRDEP